MSELFDKVKDFIPLIVKALTPTTNISLDRCIGDNNDRNLASMNETSIDEEYNNFRDRHQHYFTDMLSQSGLEHFKIETYFVNQSKELKERIRDLQAHNRITNLRIDGVKVS